MGIHVGHYCHKVISVSVSLNLLDGPAKNTNSSLKKKTSEIYVNLHIEMTNSGTGCIPILQRLFYDPSPVAYKTHTLW